MSESPIHLWGLLPEFHERYVNAKKEVRLEADRLFGARIILDELEPKERQALEDCLSVPSKEWLAGIRTRLSPDERTRLDAVRNGILATNELWAYQFGEGDRKCRHYLTNVRSYAKTLLRKSRPELFEDVDAWTWVVSELADSFTVHFADPPSFEKRLEDYCAKARQKAQHEPDAFSAEIAELDQSAFAAQFVTKFATKFPDKAAAVGTSQESEEHEAWYTAVEATKLANRLTGVERDWASFWRGFCVKHGVKTRAGRKKDGTTTDARREVEIGSLARTILQHNEEFEKATPEAQQRKNAIFEKIRREHGLGDLREKLLAAEP